ncbi:hypothetical protein M1B72_01070 [Geomonas paludis]|uniref:Uncharacterized protein n=1 Tax=Geomonas paludis TaxID=2740185 RepID=A0A6V8N2G0_9BACT|nr:hypothetical protein [Geomonas paludis]UPU36323.1 hypothetical protein M1B72_01070 [Geomonas paludis]GFO66154.1 hypothetical protein GMPD_40730 [Geomonas paludis]
MRGKAIGVALGVAGMVLWFMPLVKVGFNVYAAGRQIGHVSYILMVCSLAYAIFSFFDLHKLRAIAATISTAISLLLLSEAWNYAAWGLYGLNIVSVLSWLAAVSDWDAGKRSVEDTEG